MTIRLDPTALPAQAQTAVTHIRRNSSVLVEYESEEQWTAFVEAMKQAREWAPIVLHYLKRRIVT